MAGPCALPSDGICRTLKAPDAVHVGHLGNAPVQQRKKLREQQWHGRWQVLDQPKESGERERLRWEGVLQARSWEDLGPHRVMTQLRKLPQKACSPDGICYESLPFEGVTELRNMHRRWELEGRLPDQATLVALAPQERGHRASDLAHQCSLPHLVSSEVGQAETLAEHNWSTTAMGAKCPGHAGSACDPDETAHM